MTGTHGKVGCLKCGYIKKDCVCKVPDYAIRYPKVWMEDIGEKF